MGLEENFVGPEGNFVGPEDTWLKLRRRGGKQVGPAKKTLYTSTKYVGGNRAQKLSSGSGGSGSKTWIAHAQTG